MVRRKKEMSGFDILCLEQEFQALVDGNFDKAYQPSRDEVLLRFRAPEEGRFDVAIGLGSYITRTQRSRDNPMHPPEFSRQLRKHLTGGKILDVHQHAFDRVLVFEIGKSDGVYQLIVESFHNGNVVLVKDDEIVVPLIHTEWSSRKVRPGREWRFPPIGLDPRAVNEPELMAALRDSDTDAVRTLASVGNLGPLYAEEVCLRAGIDKAHKIEAMDPSELVKLVQTTRALIEEVIERPDPVIVLDEDGEPVQATPVPLQVHEGLQMRHVDTLSKALDELFGPHTEDEIQDDRLDKVEQMKERLQRQIDDIKERYRGFKREEDASRAKGDLLYAHFQDVQDVLAQAVELHEEHGWGPLFEQDISSGQIKLARPKPENGRLLLALPDPEGHLHEIEAELYKSVGKNAERLYEHAKELKEKQQGARRALAHAKKELAEVEERGADLVDEIEAEHAAPEPTQRFWFERYRWTITSTGNLAIAGKDARSNEKVVKKHLEESDRYVHANMSGAPSVVVKADEDGKVPEQALEEAAQFAVAYSKAWSSQLGRSEAYWVTPPQVSKTPESGEYLPTGSFVIRGERNYIRQPIQAAVGSIQHQGHLKIMGGPVAAVEARSNAFIVLEPGRTDPGDLASTLSDIFDVPVEEIQNVLPPGDVRIVRSKGINEDALEGIDR